MGVLVGIDANNDIRSGAGLGGRCRCCAHGCWEEEGVQPTEQTDRPLTGRGRRTPMRSRDSPAGCPTAQADRSRAKTPLQDGSGQAIGGSDPCWWGPGIINGNFGGVKARCQQVFAQVRSGIDRDRGGLGKGGGHGEGKCGLDAGRCRAPRSAAQGTGPRVGTQERWLITPVLKRTGVRSSRRGKRGEVLGIDQA